MRLLIETLDAAWVGLRAFLILVLLIGGYMLWADLRNIVLTWFCRVKTVLGLRRK